MNHLSTSNHHLFRGYDNFQGRTRFFFREIHWKTNFRRRYHCYHLLGLWLSSRAQEPTCIKHQAYCWWLKSCTTWDVWNPIINGINDLSTGAGFLPSTVYQFISTYFNLNCQRHRRKSCCFAVKMIRWSSLGVIPRQRVYTREINARAAFTTWTYQKHTHQ